MIELESLQISDLIPQNPDPEDPLFNSKIAAKEEYAECAPLALKEPPPSPGGSYKHQIFGERFIIQNDRCLLCHMPGTGKSCIMIHAAEVFREEYNKVNDDITKINGAILLVSGTVLADNLKNEILCKCTDGTYITPQINHNLNDPAKLAKAIERSIKTWYEILTYYQFAKKIDSFKRNEDKISYLSNKIILVDEAHNLPTDRDKTARNPKKTTRRYFTTSIKEEMEEAEVPEEETIEETEIEVLGRETEEEPVLSSVYKKIHEAFHMANRTKIVLATATPMINSPVDICALLNLILPLDKQMKITKLSEFLKDYDTVEKIEPYFRGYISYIRSFETGAFPLPQGIHPPAETPYAPPDGWRVFVEPCQMSELQESAYIEAESEGNSLFMKRKQAANFVFPFFRMEQGERIVERVEAGKPAFNEYIVRVGNSYEIKAEYSFFKEYLRDESSLEIMSAKYAKIIKLCKEASPLYDREHEVFLQHRVNDVSDRGIVFVYFSEFVVGSGVILLGICLKAHGYEEFTEDKSIFVGVGREEGRGGPCAGVTKSKVERESRKSKAPRFAILRGGRATNREKYKALFDTLNSYENRFGEYLQVMIGSRVSKEGISINNAIMMIFAQGSWNFSNNNQAMNRVLRATSHEARLSSLPPGKNNIPVKIYNLVSVKRDGGSTIDLESFLHSELKDRRISKVMRYLKQCAVDCYINRARNIRPETDVQGSEICDYQACDYKCMGIDEEYIKNNRDFTSKLIFYSEKEIEKSEEFLKNLFSIIYSAKLSDIYNYAKLHNLDVDPIYINIALERMIRENKRIIDRLGYHTYIRESSNGIIFLQKDPFSIGSEAENTVYNAALTGTQDPNTNTFSDYASTKIAIEELETIGYLFKIDPEFHEIADTLLEEWNEERFQDLIGRLELIDRKDVDYLINLLRSEELNEEDAKDIIQELIDKYPIFDDEVNFLSLGTKVELVEQTILKLVSREPLTIQEERILSIFGNQIANIEEPVDALQSIRLSMSGKGTGRGRKPHSFKSLKLEHGKKVELMGGKVEIPEFQSEELGGTIILHSLLNEREFDTTEYARLSTFLKGGGARLRLLDINAPKRQWRDPDRYEEEIYTTYFSQRFSDIRTYFEQFEVYGIKYPPKYTFLIRDKKEENISRSKEDKRKIRSGLSCKTWTIPSLVALMQRLNIDIGEVEIPETVTRQEMIERLKYEFKDLDELDDEVIRYYYKCYMAESLRPEKIKEGAYVKIRRGSPSKNKLCQLIHDFFEQNNRIMTPYIKVPSSNLRVTPV